MSKRLLKRLSLNLLAWPLLAAFYTSICLNIALFKQVLQALLLDPLYNVLVFLSMSVATFDVVNIVLTLSSSLWPNRPPACLFVLVGAAAQCFIMTYDIVIDRSMIASIIDTTPAESYALMTPQMLLTLGFSGVLTVLIACWIKIKPTTSRLRSISFRGVNILISVLLILLVVAPFHKDYASLLRNNKGLVKSLSPSNNIIASWSWHSHQRSTNLLLIRIGEDAHHNPLVQNGKRKNLTILIVGGTSRVENFSLNGHPCETSPRLAKGNVVYFPNTASCGTATAVSVPYMFSGTPREHCKEELAQYQEGVLDIVQRMGINVLWNDNDGDCKGVCDRVPHQNVTVLNLPGQCINGECYDEVLSHGPEEYTGNLQSSGLIVLHTIGSHGPTYYSRYPPQFRKLTSTCDTNEIQTCT